MAPREPETAPISPRVTLVLGGARSGKSRRAEAIIRSLGGNRIYIATAQAFDAEMEERIAQHRLDRGTGWTTIEEPLALADALSRTDGAGPRLVDCLTLWLSNLMLGERDWAAACEALIPVLADQRSPVVLVSNEVGMGIVPENRLARHFRDAQGRLNQQVAQIADAVEFVAAGIPMKLR